MEKRKEPFLKEIAVMIDVEVHVGLEKQDVLIRKEYLYNMEEHHGEFVPAEVFGMSFYPGHVPTFQVLIEGQFIFSYLPVNALATKEVDPLTLEQSNYVNCPLSQFTVDNFFAIQSVYVYDLDGSFRDEGFIVLTVDWWQANECTHLIKLNSGNFIFRPNHKVAVIKSEDEVVPCLPDYKKLRHDWIL